jgi:cell division protein FtsW (lipid II flippase)
MIAGARPSWYGWALLLPVIPLCLAGWLTLNAIYGNDGPPSITRADVKHLMFIVIGLCGMAVAVGVGYRRVGRFAYLVYALCILLLIVLVLDRWVNIPFVPYRSNARRWIEVGPIRVQPSELMKIAFVLTLAWYLRYRSNYRRFRGLIWPFALTLLPMALIKLQPDLGMLLLFLPVLFAMLFAAGAKAKHLTLIIAMGLACLPVFWLKIAPYQRLRIVGVFLQSETLRDYFAEEEERWQQFRPPDMDEAEWQRQLTQWESWTGYQLVHSKVAIASGGPFGHGWAQGPFVKYGILLPERQNDFIFAMVGHQWGIVGCLILVGCYLVIVVVGFDIATMTPDPFARLVAIGMTTMLAVQTLVNLLMTIGLGPITGVTLPFVSQGGSSMVSSFLTIGLLISVAQDRPILIAHRPFEFNEELERYQTVP